MIKAVLLDLDDTLIDTGIDTFFPRYLRELARYSAHILPPDQFADQLMAAFYDTLRAYEPAEPLYTRLIRRFADRTATPFDELETNFNAFYVERYPMLRDLVKPRPESPALLNWLFASGYTVVVATNPGLPYAATHQRMAWGGLPHQEYPFALITTLEEMHFGKPQAEYYAEIVNRLGVDPGEAIMVGDDWNDDLIGASAAGLHTFWITADGEAPPDSTLPLAGSGTFAEFAGQVQSGWLSRLPQRDLTPEALILRLASFPAAVDALCRSHPRHILECCPGEKEWSARDIVCHLRDHEPVDRARLQRILDEDDPFLSANIDPWSVGEGYRRVPHTEALAAFVEERTQTVAWLRSVPADGWQRPARDAIFGPTTFEEMVRFVAEHDRTHLQQMRAAISYAHTKCRAAGSTDT